MHTHLGLEARVGIEPTNAAFAEPCLTTWLPRRPIQNREGRIVCPTRQARRTFCTTPPSCSTLFLLPPPSPPASGPIARTRRPKCRAAFTARDPRFEVHGSMLRFCREPLSHTVRLVALLRSTSPSRRVARGSSNFWFVSLTSISSSFLLEDSIFLVASCWGRHNYFNKERQGGVLP